MVIFVTYLRCWDLRAIYRGASEICRSRSMWARNIETRIAMKIPWWGLLITRNCAHHLAVSGSRRWELFRQPIQLSVPLVEKFTPTTPTRIFIQVHTTHFYTSSIFLLSHYIGFLAVVRFVSLFMNRLKTKWYFPRRCWQVHKSWLNESIREFQSRDDVERACSIIINFIQIDMYYFIHTMFFYFCHIFTKW